MVEEETLAKSGKELFRELLRVYPEAEYDDYFKMGTWKDDQMRIDVQLYSAHRSEAGADDPVPLDQVKLPELPVGTKPAILAFGGVLGNAVKPMMTPGTGVQLSGAAADLREMAMFVSKYKLDPSTAKGHLAPLQPHRRKYVIANFTSTNTAAEAMTELEKYLKECEENKKWDADAPATLATAAVAAPKTATATLVRPAVTATLVRPVSPGAVTATSIVKPPGAKEGIVRPPAAVGIVAPGVVVAPGGAVKRPVVAPQTIDASKRPRISVGQVAPAANVVRPAGAALVRPPGAAVVRPGGVVSAPRPGFVRPPQQQWGAPRAVVAPQKW